MLSDTEHDIMKHATSHAGRNYFFADDGDKYDEIWLDLCDRGLAIQGGNSLSSDNVYHVTQAGMKALGSHIP